MIRRMWYTTFHVSRVLHAILEKRERNLLQEDTNTNMTSKPRKRRTGLVIIWEKIKNIWLIGTTGISLRLITIGEEGRLRKLSTLTASTHRWKSTRESWWIQRREQTYPIAGKSFTTTYDRRLKRRLIKRSRSAPNRRLREEKQTNGSMTSPVSIWER